MAEFDADKTGEQLEKIMATFGSVFGANSKSAKALEIAYAAQVKQIMKVTGYKKEEAEAALKLIKQQEELARVEEIRSKAIAEAMVKTLAGLKDLAGGAINSANAAYTSSELFSGVAPTLQMLGNVVKTVTDVISTAFSGIPIMGGVFKAADKAMAAVVDISIQVMTTQLQQAQHALNTYNAMSKAGAHFSGSIEDMRKHAAAAGVNIDSFSKFIQTSASDLARLGIGMQEGSVMIGKIGQAAINADRRLLLMYGNFENLNSAVADFAARQASYGYDVFKNQDKLKNATVQYLTNLKDLTDLTGLNAERLRREDEERARRADYLNALDQLADPAIAERVKQTLSRVGIEYGKKMDEFGSEVFARNGDIISEASLQTEAFAPAMAAATRELVALAKDKSVTDAAEYERRRAEIIKKYEPTVKRQQEELAKTGSINRAANDATVGLIDELGRGAKAGETYRLSTEKVAEEIAKREADRKKGAPADVKTISDALIEANKYKMDVDKRVVEQISNIASLTKKLYEVNDILVQKFGKDFDSVLKKFDSILDKLLRLAEGEADKGISTTQAGIQNMQNAAGAAGARNEVVAGRIGKAEAQAILQSGYERDIAAFGGRAYLEALVSGKTGVKPIFPGEDSQGNKIDYSGLKLKSQESIAGGPANQKMIDAARIISQKYPNTIVTAFNDLWHQTNAKGSKHTQGNAADLAMPELANMTKEKRDAVVAEINKMIAGLGKAAWESKGEGLATGDHLHIEGFKNGGVTNRPAIFGEDGAEAAVPLPDGRSIPVSMDNSKLIEKLEELISITRDHADTSEKILWQS